MNKPCFTAIGTSFETRSFKTLDEVYAYVMEIVLSGGRLEARIIVNDGKLYDLVACTIAATGEMAAYYKREYPDRWKEIARRQAEMGLQL